MFSCGGCEATEKCSVASYKGYLVAIWQNYVLIRSGCCVEKSEQSSAPPQRAALPVRGVLGMLCCVVWGVKCAILMPSGACTESTELDHRCRSSCLAEGPLQGHHWTVVPSCNAQVNLSWALSFALMKRHLPDGDSQLAVFMACISLLLLWYWSCISFSHPLPFQGEAVIMTGLLVLCHRNWV